MCAHAFVCELGAGTANQTQVSASVFLYELVVGEEAETCGAVWNMWSN